jgi:hypothetical protein
MDWYCDWTILDEVYCWFYFHLEKHIVFVVVLSVVVVVVVVVASRCCCRCCRCCCCYCCCCCNFVLIFFMCGSVPKQFQFSACTRAIGTFLLPAAYGISYRNSIVPRFVRNCVYLNFLFVSSCSSIFF